MHKTFERRVQDVKVGDSIPPKSMEKVTFSFGRNWQDFVDHCLDSERERVAITSLVEFLERKDLTNLIFLDIGSGSGLFSLAAYRLGAKEVVSLDVDPFSVECTTSLYRDAGAPESWSVICGSILDRDCIEKLESADLVYAWGSLHHSGAMWDAIRNASNLVSSKGMFYLGIYNRVDGSRGSEFWLRVKKRYNRANTFVKRVMEVAFVLRYQVLPETVRFNNPFSYWKNYWKRRGMSPWIDVRDWLGGYPYEFATADDVRQFCQTECGLKLVKVKEVANLGVNEYLFQK